MADDSEPDILSFAEEAAKQKSKKSGYIYREPAYLPRITLQIVPKADGFNVRMIFFFKKPYLKLIKRWKNWHKGDLFF